MLEWRIVYPCGDRTCLDIAQVRSYEKDQWSFASKLSWKNTHDGEQHARVYMKELAEKHGLHYPGKTYYLD